MADIMETLFGPLDRKFCDYFWLLSVLGFVLLAVLLISSLLVGISKNKGMDFYFQTISIALTLAALTPTLSVFVSLSSSRFSTSRASLPT